MILGDKPIILYLEKTTDATGVCMQLARGEVSHQVANLQ